MHYLDNTENRKVLMTHHVACYEWLNPIYQGKNSILKTSKTIFNDESLHNIENKIATVKEIFEYTKEQELKDDEIKYSS